MAGQLEGKIAIVTGAARGIGEATARLFAAEGARLVLADLNAQAGEALARSLPGARFRRTDIGREEEVAALVDLAVSLHGRLDVMVNNAGLVGATGSIAAIEAQAWRDTMRVLLDGVFYGVKHAARAMRMQRSGRILATASTAGLMGGIGAHAYTAAKHGVVGLVRSAAAELAEAGICVNAIAPGVTVTGLAIDGLGGREAAMAFSRDASPMKAAILPEDIAGAFLYLAGPYGGNVTGQVLTVDGGYTAAGSAMGRETYR